MRFRYRLSLYDDDALDQEIVEFLSKSPRKQELMRSLMRAGYALIVKRQEENLAYLSSMDDKDKSLLLDQIYNRSSNQFNNDVANKTINTSDRLTSSHHTNNNFQNNTDIKKDNDTSKMELSSEENKLTMENVDTEDEDTMDFMELLKSGQKV